MKILHMGLMAFVLTSCGEFQWDHAKAANLRPKSKLQKQLDRIESKLDQYIQQENNHRRAIVQTNQCYQDCEDKNPWTDPEGADHEKRKREIEDAKACRERCTKMAPGDFFQGC